MEAWGLHTHSRKAETCPGERCACFHGEKIQESSLLFRLQVNLAMESLTKPMEGSPNALGMGPFPSSPF